MEKAIKQTKPTRPDLDRSRVEQSLGNSELRYRRLFETAQDGILILDAETGAIRDVNPYLIAILGYSREEFIEKKLWEVGAFKDVQASKDAFEALQRNEYIRYENLPLKAKDGRLIQVEFVSNVYQVGEEQVIQCNIRDITEHKRLVAAMQENERKYRTLVASNPDGIFLVDLSGNFSSVNQAMCDELGISEAEFRSMNIWDIVPEQYLDQYRTRLAKILNGESLIEPSEYTVRWKNGKTLFVEILSAPYYSEKGIIGFQGIARDITARKRAEEALRESEERFRAVIENASDLIVILNPDYTIAYVSPSVERILGYTVAAVTGAKIADFVEAQDLPNFIAAADFRSQTPGSSPFSMLVRVRHADGSWRTLEGMGNNLLDQPGVSGLVINARDITARKRAEEALRQRLAELDMLLALSTDLREAQGANEMLAHALRQAMQILHAEAGSVVLRQPDSEQLRFVLAEGHLTVNAGRVIGKEKSIGGIVLRTRQPYVTLDYASDPNRFEFDQAGKIGAAVFVPLQSEVEILGILTVARHRAPGATPFSTAEVHLLTTIGEMVGNALRRARLFDDAQRRQKQTQALHSIDTVITSSLDLRLTLSVFLEVVTGHLRIDAADVLLYNVHAQTLDYASGRGFRSDSLQHTRLRLGEGYAGQAALERRVVNIPEFAVNPNGLTRAPLLASEGFVSYIGVPLIAKGDVKGVLEIFNRAPIEPDAEWLDFLNTLATEAAIAIDNATLFSDLQRSNDELGLAYDATITGWSRALDLRDKETEGHTQRAAETTLRLAKAMGIGDTELAHIRRGVLLHDIGKMGVPDSILLKPGKLTDEEWVVMRKHPQLAYDMLLPIAYLKPALDIPYCHHEKWDGSGYPRGLKGEQIPLTARIFAIVDVWDALTSDRPYRKAWNEEKARAHILASSGTHFDPHVVNVCLESGVLGTHAPE